MKLGVVGDLSQNDPSRLVQALDAALAVSDVVVQLGDINPAYGQLKDRIASHPNKILVIPGNHDTQGPGNWDADLPGMPKQWRKDFPLAIVVGVDNSSDRIDDAAWELLKAADNERAARHLFVAMHKPLTPIHMPDGTVSVHMMGGDTGSVCGDAWKFISWAKGKDIVLLCGHFHAAAVLKMDYGTTILEGRGGAATQIGYTVISIEETGWTAHEVTF